MTKKFELGDRVKYCEAGVTRDIGTVVCVGDWGSKFDPTHVVVFWETEAAPLATHVDAVHLLEEDEVGECEAGGVADVMSVAELKAVLAKIDGSLRVSGVRSLFFHFG